MGLGDKAAAFALTEQAMAASRSRKTPDGPIPIEILARVAAKMEEPDRAITALKKLLSIPYEGALAAKPAAHSCVAPARSDVRPAPERSALPKTLRGKAAVNLRDSG